MKTSGDILTKMRMTILFQNEWKDMNIEENSVVELKKELIRHKRKKNHFRYFSPKEIITEYNCHCDPGP